MFFLRYTFYPATTSQVYTNILWDIVSAFTYLSWAQYYQDLIRKVLLCKTTLKSVLVVLSLGLFELSTNISITLHK